MDYCFRRLYPTFMAHNYFTMYRITHLLLAALAGVILFSSCKKEPEGSSLRYIPADSDVVLTVNMGQLSSKMNFNEIKNSSGLGFIGGLLAMQGIPNFIADRSVTGVDFDQHFHLFFDMEDRDTPKGGVAFQLADTDVFTSFIQQVGKNISVENGDGFSYLNAGDALLGWKGSAGLLLMEELTEEGPSAILDQYFNLPAEKSMQAAAEMSTIASGSHDIAMMLKPAGLQKVAAAEGVTFDLGDDVVFINTMEFKEGEIVSTGVMTGSKATLNRYRQMIQPTFNTDLLEGLPPATYPAYFTMRMDGAGFDDFLSSTGLYELIAQEEDDDMLAGMALFRELSSALTGELFVGFSGIETLDIDSTAVASLSDTYPMEEDFPIQVTPKWSMVMGVADQSAITAFLDQLVVDSVLRAEEGYYVGLEGDQPGIIVLRNGGMYLTTYGPYFEALINGNTAEAPTYIVDNLKKYPFYASIDGNHLYASMEKALAGSGIDLGVLEQVEGAMETMEKATLLSYPPTDTEWKSEIRITMKNQEKNALEVVTASAIKSIMDLGMMGL